MGLPITPFNPQQPDILGTYARLAQIKGAQQQQRMGDLDVKQKQLEVQAAQQAQDDSQKLTAVYQQSGGDLDKFLQALPQSGASATGIEKAIQGVSSMKQSVAAMSDAEIKHHEALNNAVGPLLQKVLDAPPEARPAVYQQVHQMALNDPLLYPVASKQPPTYPGDQSFGLLVAANKSTDQLIKERQVAAEEKTATARETTANAASTSAENKVTPPTLQQISDATNTIGTYSAIPQNMRAGLLNELKNAATPQALQKVQERADAANASFQRSADARQQASTLKDVGLQQVMAGKLVTEDEKLGSALDQTSALRGLLDMSKGGNETATAAAQTRFAEHEIVEGGIKRMNQVEFNQLATNLGDYGRQFKAWADKGFQGQMPAATNAEMQKILDAEDVNANATHDRNIGYISSRYGAASPKPAGKSAAPLPTSSPTTTASPKMTVGQRVSIKGKQLTVTAIHPDGSFDAK